MLSKQIKELKKKWLRIRQLLKLEHYRLILDTAHCNLKCSMCPRGGLNGLENPEKGLMSFELFKKIIEKFIHEKVRIFSIEFGNWGEPLLNPDLPKMIRFARSNAKWMAPDLDIFSNTTLNHLPDPMALLESGINRIKISVSGMTQEIYSRNHQGGNIEVVLSNILKLVDTKNKSGLKNIRLGMIFHEYLYNKHEVEIARKFCNKHGLTFGLRRTYIPCVEDNIEFLKHKEKLSGFYSQFIDLDKEISLMKTLDPADACYCRLRWNRVTVHFNGQLYRCCGVFEKKFFLGSVFDFKIIDIPQMDSEICKKCAETPVSWRESILPLINMMGKKNSAKKF